MTEGAPPALRSQDVTADAPGAGVAPEIVRVVRGQPVVLDADLAPVFETTTKALNQQVKRNADRFGDDFVFRLTPGETAALRSQDVTANPGRGGSRVAPNAFTEHGVVMAATVLRTPRAAAAARHVVRAFVAARQGGVLARLPGSPAANRPADPALRPRLHAALTRALDAIASPDDRGTIRDEARAIAREGLDSLREHLRKAGVQNEKTLAEIQKILAETEKAQAEAEAVRIANRDREFALLIKQMRLVMQAEDYLASGDGGRFLDLLGRMEDR